MTPISPYAALVAELRSQAARCRLEGTTASIAASVTYGSVAGQLEALEAHDLYHAAIWRQRYHEVLGADPPADLRDLSPQELDAREAALRGHLDAVRAREQTLEAELLAVEMEQDRSKGHDTMKITLLEIKNYKRIHEISITPGESSLMLIGGNNRQGKSSLIGALSAALGGGKEAPEEPVRRGQRRADITVELDDGDLVVHRRFSRNGKSTLEVRSKTSGKQASPQKMLDTIVGTRFLDPLKFSRLTEKQQRDKLIAVVDIGIDLKLHANERMNAYNARTIANRDVKRLEAEVESSPEPDSIPDPVDPDALMATLDVLQSRESESVTAGYTVHEIDRSHEGLTVVVKNTKARVEQLRAELANWEADVIECTKRAEGYEIANRERRAKAVTLSELDITDEIAAAQDAIKAAYAVNEERAKLVAQGAKHMEASAALKTASAEADRLSDQIETLDEQKAVALSAATMPIEGLDIDDDQVLYGGLPLTQASGAEQLQVSLAIAAALSPKLRDIWVMEGSLLDDDSIETVRAFAKDNDLRFWLERVGTSDDDAIIISEGSVKE